MCHGDAMGYRGHADHWCSRSWTSVHSNRIVPLAHNALDQPRTHSTCNLQVSMRSDEFLKENTKHISCSQNRLSPSPVLKSACIGFYGGLRRLLTKTSLSHFVLLGPLKTVWPNFSCCPSCVAQTEFDRFLLDFVYLAPIWFFYCTRLFWCIFNSPVMFCLSSPRPPPLPQPTHHTHLKEKTKCHILAVNIVVEQRATVNMVITIRNLLFWFYIKSWIICFSANCSCQSRRPPNFWEYVSLQETRIILRAENLLKWQNETIKESVVFLRFT